MQDRPLDEDPELKKMMKKTKDHRKLLSSVQYRQAIHARIISPGRNRKDEQLCRDWNSKNKIGTKVRFFNGSMDFTGTIAYTDSRAFMTWGFWGAYSRHEAVIYLQGYDRSVSLADIQEI